MAILRTWDTLTVEVNGRQIKASWAVEDGMVRVITPFGRLATQIGGSQPRSVAEWLARELAWKEEVAKEKATREEPQENQKE
jgi:hypothetical protein